MHPYITIWNTKIPVYWIMGIVGILVCYLWIKISNKKYKLEKCDVTNIMAMIAVGGIIGSKVLYIFTILPALIKSIDNINHPIKFIEHLLTTGFVFYGGLLGAIVAVYLYCKRYEIDMMKVSVLFTPAVPLFHFFGRIGCYFAGCCYGINHFPLQIVEAIFNLALFFILLYFQGKAENSYKLLQLYILLYAVGRFIFEFFRGDIIRGHIFMFSVSQWISLILIIAVVTLFIKGVKRARKGN